MCKLVSKTLIKIKDIPVIITGEKAKAKIIKLIGKKKESGRLIFKQVIF